mmetsp:Transcript_3608/g.8698  ORF Transcript_3608/g.8698 Transcript_3608/m.8698 type:complete len:223 (-) Transcript_3608:716-1384(-)
MTDHHGTAQSLYSMQQHLGGEALCVCRLGAVPILLGERTQRERMRTIEGEVEQGVLGLGVQRHLVIEVTHEQVKVPSVLHVGRTVAAGVVRLVGQEVLKGGPGGLGPLGGAVDPRVHTQSRHGQLAQVGFACEHHLLGANPGRQTSVQRIALVRRQLLPAEEEVLEEEAPVSARIVRDAVRRRAARTRSTVRRLRLVLVGQPLLLPLRGTASLSAWWRCRCR